MKKHMSSLMRLGAWCGGVLAFMLVLGGIAALLGLLMMDTAQAGRMPVSNWSLLAEGLKTTGYTLSTALAAVLLSFPLSWSLSILISFAVPDRWRERLTKTVNGLSAVPAVVFGYMSLSYYVPAIESPWWAVVHTLVLMSMMRQTLALVRVNQRYYPAVEAADALGAYFNEKILQIVLPRAARGYLAVALRMMTRALCEGVAILLVLSNYSGDQDTLATALMKALGVTGENDVVQWVLLLAVLLLILVLMSNTLISACVHGGRHGKTNAK